MHGVVTFFGSGRGMQDLEKANNHRNLTKWNELENQCGEVGCQQRKRASGRERGFMRLSRLSRLMRSIDKYTASVLI